MLIRNLDKILTFFMPNFDMNCIMLVSSQGISPIYRFYHIQQAWLNVLTEDRCSEQQIAAILLVFHADQMWLILSWLPG